MKWWSDAPLHHSLPTKKGMLEQHAFYLNFGLGLTCLTPFFLPELASTFAQGRFAAMIGSLASPSKLSAHFV